jgi:hypothetical protein
MMAALDMDVEGLKLTNFTCGLVVCGRRAEASIIDDAILRWGGRWGLDPRQV